MIEPGWGDTSARAVGQEGTSHRRLVGRVALVGRGALAAALLAVAPSQGWAQPSMTPPTPPPPADAPPAAPPASPDQVSPAPPTAPVSGVAAEPTSDAPTGPRDIVILTPGSRSRNTDILLASLAGAAVIFGGLGVYWNLDANTAANNVSATAPTGLPWNAAEQHEYDRAHDSSVKAGVFYGIGGALLLGAAAGLIVTSPPSHKDVIHPRMAHVVPTLSPAQGGAVFGGAWRF